MFAVVWRTKALDRLADAYVVADPTDRDAIEQATTRLNAALADDPNQVGESRSGRLRVAHDAPCAIKFLIHELIPGVVRVVSFWTF